jgi:hypothetical protein
MIINQENPKGFNPHLEGVRKNLQNKYNKLSPTNKTDETVWTGVGVFVLHAIIAIGTFSIVANMDTSTPLGVILSAFILVLAIVTEVLKSRFQERFLIYDLAENDEDNTEDERFEAFREKGFNQRILIVIYAFSALFFITNGVFIANKHSKFKEKDYDLSFQKTYDKKNEIVSLAQKNGLSVKRIQDLQKEADTALENFQLHKSTVDLDNKAGKSDNRDIQIVYALLAIGICTLLELMLFGCRKLHETKQYKIAKKVLKERQSKKQTKQEVTAENKKCEKCDKLRHEVSEQGKQISRLKGLLADANDQLIKK